jgi:hypothetical protein
MKAGVPVVEGLQTDGEYKWRALSSPVARGWALRLFAWIVQTPLWPFIYKLQARRSGIPQVRQQRKHLRSLRSASIICMADTDPGGSHDAA